MQEWIGHGLVSPWVLSAVTSDYIPYPFLKNLNLDKLCSDFKSSDLTNDFGAETLQKVMDNSNYQLRMYGTGKELAENLSIYRNFPKRHLIFKASSDELLFIIPTYYKSLNNEKRFISKYDMLMFLQNFVLRMDVVKFNPLLTHFLKQQETALHTCCEFLEYDVKVFKEIEEEVRSIVTKAIAKYEKCPMDVNELEEKKKSNHIYRFGMPRETEQIVKDLREIVINKRPEMFYPAAPLKGEPILRIFEDEGQQFFIEIEACNSALKYAGLPLQNEMAYDGLFYASQFEDFVKEMKDQFNPMVYIRVPIQRAKHAAVPILTPQGNHCILAVDVLFEQLHVLIFGVKALQKLKKDQMNVLEKQMKLFTPHTGKGRYLFSVPLAKDLEVAMLFHWRSFENIPAKDVRNAKKDGFTVDNLKNELINLGLIELFPEITDYAQMVYEGVLRAKKEEFLRTCDLFDAVEQCQLICIFKQFPNLQEFLHSQFACHRMPYLVCAKCEKLKIGKSGNKTTAEVKAEAPQNVPESKLAQSSEKTIAVQEKTLPSLPSEKEEAPQKPKLETKGEITDSKKTSETKTTSEKKELVQRSETASKPQETSEKIATETTKIVKSSPKSAQKTQKTTQKEVAQKAESADPAEVPKNPKTTSKGELIDSKKTSETKTTSELKENALQNAQDLKLVQRSEMAPKTEEKTEKIATEPTKIVQSSTKSVQKPQKTTQSEVVRKAESTDPNESKCCSKCLRTSELCNEAKKELKMAQNKLEKYETKAKRTMEVEKNMKEMEKEIEGMKKIEKQKESILGMKEKEIEELKMKIQKLETAETRWKIRERNLEDDQHTLLRQNSQLESHLKRESLKSETSFQQNRDQQNKLQTTIAAKNKLIDVMQARINRLLEQNNDKEETISSLIQQIAAPTPPPTTVVTVVDTVDAPITTIRYQMISLQKIKDSFRHGWQLKYAKDMVERLISLSPESPEIHEFARYEMEQYELKTRDYLQGVEMNIQKIKETQNPIDVIPLPQPPMLSARFMKEYWIQIDKKKEKKTSDSESTPNPEDVPSVPEGVVSDTECLICFCEMSDEKTLKCEHCKKVVHLTCAAKWLKIHRSCPHCRREQLDPDEFPKLS